VIFPKPAYAVPTSKFEVASDIPPDLESHFTTHSRNISRDERDIIETHVANHEMPIPFVTSVRNVGNANKDAPQDYEVDEDSQAAPPYPGERSQSSLSISSVYTVSVSIGRTGNGLAARSSHMSISPSPLNPSAHRESPSIDSSSSRLSFYSAQSGVENRGTPRPTSSARLSLSNFRFPKLQRPLSRPMSAASRYSAFVFAQNTHSAMNKKALQAFTPLLPDELPVYVDDTLSLLQIFDDGWCVCMLEEPLDGHSRAVDVGSDIRMGCVPLWVFERKSKSGAQPLRTMRSTSLAVTIELTPQVSPAGGLDAPARPAWETQPIISWSNF
jgi:hypothetical protein